MNCAQFVLATSPATNRYDRLCKECLAGVFVMDCFTREESRALRSVFIASILFCLAYSLSIIHGLDTEHFLENYDKWGPFACTCLILELGVISEDWLKKKVALVAKKFAQNFHVIDLEADPDDGSHWLFTSFPFGPKRDCSVLKVPTLHLKRFIVDAIASSNTARQIQWAQKPLQCLAVLEWL